jgi:flagellar basal-body rod modification protein FlgD
MAVGGISGSGSSSLNASRQSIADNFDTFLSLLTTQLKNQNPLDPLDTNQFTSQLVQFTSVEQQLKTNDFLEALLKSSGNAASTQAVGYIGKEVTAVGNKSELIDGQAQWNFYLEDSAAKVNVTVKDADGKVVHTFSGSLDAGWGKFTWDGVGDDGKTYPDGSYVLSIDARDADGGYIPARTELGGIVSGVDLSGSEPVLLVGDARINLSMVTSVKEPEPDANPDPDPDGEGDGEDDGPTGPK